MAARGLSSDEVASRRGGNIVERVLTLISKQTSGEVESALRAFFPIDVCDKFSLALRIDNDEVIKDINMVAVLVNHGSFDLTSQNMAKLRQALAAIKRDDTVCSKISFYPKGRALIDAAEAWYCEGAKSLQLLQETTPCLERLALASEDKRSAGLGVTGCVSQLRGIIEVHFADACVDRIQASLLAPVDRTIRGVAKAALAHFVELVGPT